MNDRSIEVRLAQLPWDLEPPAQVWDAVWSKMEGEESPRPDFLRQRAKRIIPAAAALFALVVGLVLAGVSSRSGTTDLSRLAADAPADLAELYTSLDQLISSYEAARADLLETIEMLADVTGQTDTYASLERRIELVDAEIGALVLDMRSDPMVTKPVFELAMLLASETAALGEIQVFAEGFAN